MEKLALDQIIVSNPYLRTDTDIEALKKSIEAVGLINPLTVNKENKLLAGGRRYQALKDLDISEATVQRIDLSELEQELISIDENLVRTPLNKIEFENCLNRGREIYEQLNPTANKVETEVREMTPEQKREIKAREEADTTSFAAITAEKTGLSKAVIKKAIQRDEQSSKIIKEARAEGKVSASQVNEIIQLDKKDQDKILEHVKNKSVNEVRKMVKLAQQEGLEAAIEEAEKTTQLPREFTQLEAITKKTNKLLTKILIEDIYVEEDQISKLIKQVNNLNKQSAQFMERFSNEPMFIPANDEIVKESPAFQ